VRRSIVLLTGVASLVASCSGPEPAASHVPRSPTAATNSTTSGPDGTSLPPLRFIRLPHVPRQGIAIQHHDGGPTLLLNLRGDVVARLHRFTIVPRRTDRPPGDLVVRHGDRRYRLRPGTSTLERLHGRLRTSEGTIDPSVLPPPGGSVVAGSPSGDWRWATLAPNGNALLGQWSGFVFGSCSTSGAYMTPIEEGATRPVTGTARIKHRPTSYGLGWTRNDRAVAFLPGIGCAGTEPVRPGVYAFSAPGRGTRILRARVASAVQMWGSGIHPLHTTIHLPMLPSQGVAVERHGGVQLVSTKGRVIATLPGFSIDRATDRPGSLVVVHRDQWYLLDRSGGVFRRISERRGENLRRPDDPRVSLPPPRGTRFRGEVHGHWRWMQRSPRGSDVLAQWSGECEAPTAFLSQGGELRPVTGGTSIRGAPESFALGWTIDGRAVVLLPRGACGSSSDQPGVYLFRRPGAGQLLVGTGSFSGARMWGPR
jgi:hypothetical protein